MSQAGDEAGTVVLLHAEQMGRGEFFALTKDIQVGQVSNMREIVQRTMTAAKVVTV